MSKILARIAFYPSLVWDGLICLAHGLNKWDEVEQGVWLGAFPVKTDVARLHQLGVKAVINTCEEREGPVEDYQHYGIEQIRIPVVDFTEPTVEQIKLAVELIQLNRERGNSIYVHCKSGRGRSSTMVLCWLVQSRDLAPEAAQAILQAKRKQVLRNLFKRKSVQRFRSGIVSKASNSTQISL